MKNLLCVLTVLFCGTVLAKDEGPGTYFVPAKGTANVSEKVAAKPGAVRQTVAFLGGSITEMNGFRPRVMKLLRAKYPEIAFTEIASGLSSTCSDAGAFRLEDVKRGCKIAYVKDVPQGRTCLVRAYTKGGKPSGTVYYTQDCAWRFPLGRAEMTFETTPDADGWSVGYAVVTVPPGADGFGVQFGGVGDGTIRNVAFVARSVPRT